jgi:ABC-type anion transport system duplicated permease subunit
VVGGAVFCALWGIYVAYISISVISHIDQGLSRSFDLASEAFDIPPLLLEICFFSLPVIGASAIFGLRRLMRPPWYSRNPHRRTFLFRS